MLVPGWGRIIVGELAGLEIIASSLILTVLQAGPDIQPARLPLPLQVQRQVRWPGGRDELRHPYLQRAGREDGGADQAHLQNFTADLRLRWSEGDRDGINI